MEKLFGRAYDSVGSTSSDFIIKTRGLVKVLWGNKFIDLIKDGKLNCDSDILNIVSTKDKIGKDGIYYVEEDESVILVIDGKQISLFGEIGTMYVSFLGKLETKGEEKYLALTNIGFIYKTMEEASASGLPGGIVYVEDSLKLYIVLNGQLIEYLVSLPNPITLLVVILKSDSKEGALLIKGLGIENALIVGDILIYSKEDTSIINSPNSINICILNSEKILIRDNITFKPDVIFDLRVISDYIQSKSATPNFGFRLYMKEGKSYLEVDNLIVRNSDLKETLAFPFYWASSNNVISSSSIDLNTGEIGISTILECTYAEGDIVVIYVNYEEYYNEESLTKIVPMYILISEANKLEFQGIIQNLSDISDIIDEEGGGLKDSYIYLVASKTKNIVRIGEQNIDLYNTSEYEKINDLKTVNTRIGNIKELNKEFTLLLDGKERKLKPREDISIGIYSEALVSNKSELFNASLFAPIFKGGPNNDIYPRYDEGFEIPKEDETKTIVTSEWVKKWLRLICPPGTIVLWSGAVIPEGWALCDGTNGTPNLIGKFIKADTSSGEVPSELNENNELIIKLENLPIHSHPHQEHTHNIEFKNASGITSSESVSVSSDETFDYSLSDSSTSVVSSVSGEGVTSSSTSVVDSVSASYRTVYSYGGYHSHTVSLNNLSADLSKEISKEKSLTSSEYPNKPIKIEPRAYKLLFIMKLDY